MDTPLVLKPHHLVDIVTALGNGVEAPAPHPYGHAVHTVTARVLGQPETLVRLEYGADDICAPCVHSHGGLCVDTIDTSYRPAAPTAKQAWNLLLDQRWCERLGLQPGDQLTALAFCQLLQERAGDITSIYREIAPARTADRRAKLEAGVQRFLERARALRQRGQPAATDAPDLPERKGSSHAA